MTTNDALLLKTWVRDRSEAAFTQLVERHLPFVYSSARRQVGEDELAKEVAQSVFLILAWKTPRLENDAHVQGWLFRTTRFVALRALRDQARQKRRDQEAYAMSHQYDTAPGTNPGWEELSPHIDAALASLAEGERQAILLRYFDKQPVKAVAAQLGIDEEAGKKRLQRGLEKLRRFFLKHGLTIGGSALGLILASAPLTASPLGLAASIARQAVARGSTTGVKVPKRPMFPGIFLARWGRMTWMVASLAIVSSMVYLTVGHRIRSKRNASTAESFQILASEAPGSDAKSVAELSLDSPHSVMLLTVLAEENEMAIPGAVLHLTAITPQLRTETVGDVVAAATGVARIPLKSNRLKSLKIYLSAPDRVPVTAVWQGHELEPPFISETIHLSRAADVQGVVLAKESSPGALSSEVVVPERHGVAGAHLSVGALVPGTPGRIVSIGPDGGWQGLTGLGSTFVVSNLPSSWASPQGLAATVEAPGFVSIVAPLSSLWVGSNSMRVQLEAHTPLRGRVISRLSQQPIPEAKLSTTADGPQIEAVSDVGGRFQLSSLPAGSYVITVRATGFGEAKFLAKGIRDGPEAVIELSPDESTVPVGGSQSARVAEADPSGGPPEPHEVRIEGTVKDIVTKLPLPRFSVSNHREFLGYGVDGHFSWNVLLTTTQGIYLRVNAEGYEPFQSDFQSNADSEIPPIEISMLPQEIWKGTVLMSDGQPVAGAKGFIYSYRGVVFDPVTGHVSGIGDDAREFSTDERGGFAVPVPENYLYLAVYNAAGFGWRAVEPRDPNKTKSLVVTMNRWARIRGKLGSQLVSAQSSTWGIDSHNMDWDLSRTFVGEDGHVEWPFVPPDSKVNIATSDVRAGFTIWKTIPGETHLVGIEAADGIGSQP